VQVSKEPFHKMAMENQYFRLLDVKLKPGDTTQFHIHSTPSVFIQFTNTRVSSQLKDQQWKHDINTAGNVVYKDYAQDSIIHRVTNCDTDPFHVTDMELLSPYVSKFTFHQMSYKVLLNNERIIAYQLDTTSFSESVNSAHGPMLAALVKGSEVLYSDIVTKKSISIKGGKYMYIPPGNTFRFSSSKKNEEISMVLIEIK
jgi:alpha-glucosidase (family GH31 glycosyl hydrolase)